MGPAECTLPPVTHAAPPSPPRALASLAGAALLLSTSLLACQGQPTPMPTQQALDEAMDLDTQPPLYQLLYEAPLLPAADPAQQRVRLLIWLRHMDFGQAQLDQLSALRELVADRTRQIDQAERTVADKYAAEESAIYQGLWERLAAGAPGDAPEVVELTSRLQALQRGSERERELLRIRIEGIRAVLDAQSPFLASLSPRQEALLSDALFFLRHHLDPVANPGDFRALVGTTYEPGQYAVLTRGTTRWAREPLNIGGLWSDEPPLAGGALHEARREVILYLALLEPGMDEAIDAVRELLARELDLGLGDPPPQEPEAAEEAADGGADELDPLDPLPPPGDGQAPPPPGASPPPGAAPPGAEPPGAPDRPAGL